MAKSRKETLVSTLTDFYKKPVARVSFELFISVIAVIFFAIFAIRPTLQTMADLVKEIQDKEELVKQLDSKLASLNTAQEQYGQYSDRFYLLDEALPKRPSLLNALKIIEKIASENGLIIQDITVSNLPDEKVTAQAGSAQRDFVSFNLTLAGEYLNLRQLVESLIQSQRVFIVEQVNFGLSNSRYNQYLLAKLKISVPYYK